MSDVVVIGAGVGGLAAAARLAAGGHRVSVLEQAATAGGKLGAYARDGFRFDTGPTLLTMPGVFASLGLELELVALPPVQCRFADGSVLQPAASAAWRRMLRHAERIWAATGPSFVTAPLRGWTDAARLAARHPARVGTVAPWRTLRGAGQAWLVDPRLRIALDRYATYAGADPRRAPAALAVIPYLEQRDGCWTLPGGLSDLRDALVALAADRGAALRTGTRVRRITHAGGRVTGVELADGGRLAADVVVADADAREVYARLAPHRGLRRRLARLPASLSGFVLLLAVRGRTPGLPAQSVSFPADYDAEFDAVFGPRPAPVGDPALYVSVRAGPPAAPPGDEAWFVLVNAPVHAPGAGVDWDAPGLAAGYAAQLLDRLATRGLDVRDRLAFAEWRTPADLARATRSPGGAIYGPSANSRLAPFLRAPNTGPLRGLYCVGGSAHPGGGLPMVATSAAIVAGLIGAAAERTPAGTDRGRPARRR